MTKRSLIIATRESPLALHQAELIRLKLQQAHPGLIVELLGITTQGDKNLDVNLIEIGGKGLFVKELEEALYDKRADIAVHSMKDVPMDLPSGLSLPVIGEREDPRDVFVSHQVAGLSHLKPGMVVGTASLRRQTQLHALHPGLTVKMLRGNIQTRLDRLDKGDYDAIILAAAGLIRMQLKDRITAYIPPEDMLPSAGQGALGLECRSDDEAVHALIAPLNHLDTSLCVRAERAVCRALGGGCKLPVAAFATLTGQTLYLRALVSDQTGKQILRSETRTDVNNPEAIGLAVAKDLIAQGADKILASFL